jgi:tetratricopeptide (TPR) repeat protein
MLRDIQAKTKDVSAALYNTGLKKAEIRDLGGAESYLLCALELDKHNSCARDLLGLVYMETGRVGDAIIQWTVGAALYKRNATETVNSTAYLKKVNSNKMAIERMDSSIRLYNQALMFLRQKSEDMAYIQLKKAIELNPNLVDALNLLTLYYIKRRSKDKALALINQTLAIDVYNQTALRYYNELYPKRKLEPRTVERQPPQRANRVAANQNEESKPVYKPKVKAKDVRNNESTLNNFFGRLLGDGKLIKRVLSYAVLPVLVFFLMTFIVVPNIIDSRDKAIEEYKFEISELRSELVNSGFSIHELLAENENLASRIEGLQASVRQMAHENEMVRVNNNIIAGDYIAAAMTLERFNINEFSDDFIEQVERAKLIAYPNASERLYRDGVAKFLESEYENAMNDLLNSLRFYIDVQGVRDFRDEVYYYLGILSHDSSDFAEAIEYFGMVVDSYKSSPFYYDAVERQKRAQNSYNAVN